MLCRAIPYEGRDPYIFFSYSHKDAERVYPILEQMVRDGYRVWYDDGNHPGDDWLENIGQHLSNCHVCLAMMSKNSEASHNCKKEISFAVQCQKKLMVVMLEKFAMTVGMRMQLSDLHYLEKDNYPSNTALLSKLYDTEDMGACKGIPGSMSMRMLEESAPEESTRSNNRVLQSFVKELVPHQSTGKFIADSLPAETSAEALPAQKKAKIKAVLKNKAGSKLAHQNMVQEIAQDTLSADEQDQGQEVAATAPIDTTYGGESANRQQKTGKTEITNTAKVLENGAQAPAAANDAGYVANGTRLLLLRLSDGSAYFSGQETTRIGRSEVRCDVVIKNNPTISNHHINVCVNGGKCNIQDVGSTYGTYVNGERIAKNLAVNVGNSEIIKLHNEEFMIVYGAGVDRWRQRRIFAYLRNVDTQKVRFVEDDVVLLGRLYKWEDGALSNTNISRKHAQIFWDGQNFCLEDLKSKNGTFCNGQKLAGGEKRKLVSGDKIRLVDTTLEINIVAI